MGMHIEKITVLYWSATGNTKKITEKMCIRDRAVTLLCRIIFGSSSFLIPAMFGILVCLSLAQKRMQGRDSL